MARKYFHFSSDRRKVLKLQSHKIEVCEVCECILRVTRSGFVHV